MALLRRLEAFYDFNGGSGIDLAGGGFNLTNNNSVVEVVGIVGSGIETTVASANSMSAAVAGSPFRPGNIDWSFGIWVRIRDKTVNHRVVTQYIAAGNQRALLAFYSVSSDRFGVLVSGNGTSTISVTANNHGSPTTGEWVWFYFWHDSFNDELGIQINDGEPDVISYADGIFDSSAADFSVGSLPSPAQYSNADFDELGLWHRILTPQERADVYNAGAGNAFPFSETSVATGSIDLLNGLQSYWNFDEQGADTVKQDLVGLNDLTPKGSPPVVSALVASGVETLHGGAGTDHMVGGSGSTLLPSASGMPFSIYALVQLNSQGNGGVIFSKDHNASGLRGVRLRYSGVDRRFQFLVAPEDNFGYRTVVSDTIDDAVEGPWYHLFCWYDETENSLNMEVNGSGINTIVPASGFSGADVPFFVSKGFLGNGSEEFFPGIVDEMGVWNRVLSGNERGAIYNNGVGLSFANFVVGGGASNTLWLFT